VSAVAALGRPAALASAPARAPDVVPSAPSPGAAARSCDRLDQFVAALERAGELVRVRAEVDPVLELGEILVRTVAAGGPALLFERVKGSPFPVAGNLFGTAARVERALGAAPAALGAALLRAAERLRRPSLRALLAERHLLWRARALRPRLVRTAPVHEVVERGDLTQLPALWCWPDDAGRFITWPLVLTHHPADGGRNLGTYRMQVYDARTAGLHFQIERGGGFHLARAAERGQRLPVAVALGGPPALTLGSILPLPEDADEIAFTGLLQGRPVRLARVPDFPHPVPADAEIVLLGEVDPGERRLEGPFGDHYGHYSHAAPFPVFHLHAVARRRHPIYPATIVGRPPQEDLALGVAAQEILAPLTRLLFPAVHAVWAFPETGFHPLAAAAVGQRYEKEGVKSALGLLGFGQMSLTKCLVVCDRDVDVRDPRAVLRALRAHFDPAADFLLLPGVPFDTLDFTSQRMNLGSKMVLDATGGDAAPAPPAARPRPAARDLHPAAGASACFEDALYVVRTSHAHARDLLARLAAAPELAGVPLVAAVSDDVDLARLDQVLWGIFTRFDPARDVGFTAVDLHGAWAVPHGRLTIDATHKPGYPAPCTMPAAVREKVSARWSELFAASA
jgi:UbiD family decarboxylase